jgi:hypothetical protein
MVVIRQELYHGIRKRGDLVSGIGNKVFISSGLES